MATPKYPGITARLSGQDGNALNILGIVEDALRRGGVAEDEVEAFYAEAMSGDYDNLLAACRRWVRVT